MIKHGYQKDSIQVEPLRELETFIPVGQIEQVAGQTIVRQICPVTRSVLKVFGNYQCDDMGGRCFCHRKDGKGVADLPCRRLMSPGIGKELILGPREEGGKLWISLGFQYLFTSDGPEAEYMIPLN